MASCSRRRHRRRRRRHRYDRCRNRRRLRRHHRCRHCCRRKGGGRLKWWSIIRLILNLKYLGLIPQDYISAQVVHS